MSGDKFYFILGFVLSSLLALSPSFTPAAVAIELEAGERELLTQLDQDDMAVVHSHALEILSKCQFPECVIVSLGTTNTLIDSFLRYYLKDKADLAIHYVPLRKLSSALSLPIVVERSLPKPPPGLKRVLLVRTLEFGLSIGRFAKAVERHFATSGVPYGLEGYFTLSDRYESLNRRLDFPWPYELKQFSSVAVSRSYRQIDKQYYRFRPIAFDYFEFWREHMTDSRVVAFRESVERSLGENPSPGAKIFAMSEEVGNAWAQVKDSGSYTPEEAFLLLGYFLPFDSEVAALYKAELDRIADQIFAETRAQEGSSYKILDRAVRLFIENEKLFAAKQCAAIAGS